MHISTRQNKAWEVVKEDERREGVDRTFLVGTRFLVKCHRAGGGYACVLCSRFRKVDTIWEDIRAFAKHVSRAHEPVELSKEIDIEEVG